MRLKFAFREPRLDLFRGGGKKNAKTRRNSRGGNQQGLGYMKHGDREVQNSCVKLMVDRGQLECGKVG